MTDFLWLEVALCGLMVFGTTAWIADFCACEVKRKRNNRRRRRARKFHRLMQGGKVGQ